MKKLMAVVVLGAIVIAMSPVAAHANGAVAAALALGAFATFSILTAPFWAFAAYPPVAYQPVYSTPPAYYSAPPVTYAPPSYAPSYGAAPAIQREVLYANGRHVLYGDGVTTAYRWVWVPNPPPPPAGAPPPPPAQ
jgi:hypothetical protein